MVQNKNQQKPPPMFAKGQIVEIFFKLDEFWKKSKSLFRTLFVDGIHLLTRLKTNMKGSILSAGDSLLIGWRPPRALPQDAQPTASGSAP